MNTRDIGRIGEDYVTEYLKAHGCKILARNYCIRGGELDIVAKKGEILHIVEVKTRKAGALSGGEEAITPKKIAHIIKAARAYLLETEYGLSCVFDVAVVEIKNGSVSDLRYIQRAFTA